MNPKRHKIEVVFKNEMPEAEIRIMQSIGSDPWDDDSEFSAEDCRAALSAIPAGTPLHIMVNSPGGSVPEGFAMRTMLDAWTGKKRATILGIAASTASWVPLGCEVSIPKYGQMFIHDAIASVGGSAADMEKAAEFLNTASNQIAQMYSDKCGKPVEEMRAMMKAETLLTGEQCVAMGLCDKLIDSAPLSNFTPQALQTMRNRLAAIRNSISAPTTGAGNKKEPTNMPTTEPVAAPVVPAQDNNAAVIAELQNKLAALTEANNTAKKQRITNAVQALIDADKLTAGSKDDTIAQAMKDEAILEILNKQPAKPPGAAPAAPVTVELKNASHDDVRRGFEMHNKATQAWARGESIPMRDLAVSARNKAQFYAANKGAFVQMLNTNTLPAQLQRQVILQEVIREFALRLAPFGAFASKFENVPLQGLHTVEVPYYPLDSVASTSFNGTYSAGNSTTSYKEITVGYGTAGGSAGAGHDRLYKGLAFSSHELARQPWLKTQELALQATQKLAYDMFADVLSVVKAAAFAVDGYVGPAIGFDSQALADLKYACRKWPEMGRSLFIDSEYDAALLKDTSIKSALNFGGPEAIREGKIPRVMGFDYFENPNIPSNSENLKGFAVFKSGILFATAPTPPAEEVRNAGTTYELLVEPATGVTLEYRTFGLPATDTANHIIECSYGYAAGQAGALFPIRSAAV